MRPAPTSRTIDSATSATSSATLPRRRPAAAGPAPVLEHVVQIHPRRPPCRQRGRRPGSIASRSPRRSRGRCASIATWRRKVGNSSGAIRGYNLVPIAASAMPQAPPATDSSRFSVTSCFTSRPRPAPAAARSASSFCRPTPATSSRLATFAQPMSRTKPTVPTRNVSIRSVPPNSDSCIGTTRAPSSPRLVAACLLQLPTDGGQLLPLLLRRRRQVSAFRSPSSTEPAESSGGRSPPRRRRLRRRASARIRAASRRGRSCGSAVDAHRAPDGVRRAVELALPRGRR